MVLRARPGHLGTFARSLPCCTRKHFRQSPIDLLPIRLPQDTLEEKALMKKLNGMFTRNEPPPADLQPLLEEAQVCGESAWLWIQILLLDYLYCGGARPLGRVMPHPAEPTTEQKGAIDRLRKLVKLWLEDTTEELEVKSWEKQSQDLGDMYTGQEIRKAYKLTWASIAPHVPGPGEAGRIELADTVDPALRPYVIDPELVRIPDDELREPPPAAPVLVENNFEYDRIISHLVESGMMEREVEAETLTVSLRGP